MRLKILPEILDRALERLDSTGRKSTEGAARREEFAMESKAFYIAGLTFTFFDSA